VSAISTHVLDIAAGCPAAGLGVRLEHVAPAGPEEIARATTDSGGRITSLGPERIRPGTDDAAHFSEVPFFPEVIVTFTVADDREHYHVPLLMSPFGYSTYRGS
jgi:5-hydroxyisourate hydrolase